MKIFNHPWIESKPFYTIKTQEEIKNTPPNSIVLLSPLPSSLDIAKYCQKNAIPYIIRVRSIKEAIFANLLGAKYTISSKELATNLMSIAQNYLFDTQILAEIESDSEIEEMAKANVDGVVFS
jgi:superfamily I DNA and/or RNA helicase